MSDEVQALSELAGALTSLATANATQAEVIQQLNGKVARLEMVIHQLTARASTRAETFQNSGGPGG